MPSSISHSQKDTHQVLCDSTYGRYLVPLTEVERQRAAAQGKAEDRLATGTCSMSTKL